MGLTLNVLLVNISFCRPSPLKKKGIDTLPSGERVGYNNMIYHEHEVCVFLFSASPALTGWPMKMRQPCEWDKRDRFLALGVWSCVFIL